MSDKQENTGVEPRKDIGTATGQPQEREDATQRLAREPQEGDPGPHNSFGQPTVWHKVVDPQTGLARMEEWVEHGGVPAHPKWGLEGPGKGQFV